MTPWDSFTSRRKINTTSFLERHGLDTREKFLAHLRDIGVAPPTDDIVSSLFPAPKAAEVKVETAKAEQERATEEGAAAPRSDLLKRNRDSGTPSGTVPPEDRSNKSARSRRDI